MITNNNIRKMARTIVLTFSHYVKDRFDACDPMYLQLDIDENFASYEALFKVVVGSLLGVPVKVDNTFPPEIVDDLLGVLRKSVTKSKYKMILESPILSECTFKVCTFILKVVKEEVFGEANRAIH